MYSINIKGKVTSKDKKLVKLEMIFFQTGYNRVSKVLNITGPIKDWDNASQSFISKSSRTAFKTFEGRQRLPPASIEPFGCKCT